MAHTIRKGWVIVWEGEDEFKAHLLLGRLKAAGIPAVLYNQLDSAYHLRYLHRHATAKVLVPEAYYERARHLLTRTDSGN